MSYQKMLILQFQMLLHVAHNTTVTLLHVHRFYINDSAIKPTITHLQLLSLFSIVSLLRVRSYLPYSKELICFQLHRLVSAISVRPGSIHLLSITALIPLSDFFRVTSKMQSSPWGRPLPQTCVTFPFTDLELIRKLRLIPLLFLLLLSPLC